MIFLNFQYSTPHTKLQHRETANQRFSYSTTHINRNRYEFYTTSPNCKSSMVTLLLNGFKYREGSILIVEYFNLKCMYDIIDKGMEKASIRNTYNSLYYKVEIILFPYNYHYRQ